MEAKSQDDAAFELALKMVRHSDRFTAEIRAALGARGSDNEAIERAISRLVERRILNDRTTAQNYIDRKSGRRAVGLERLRTELLDRGAPEQIVEECLAAAGGTERQRMQDALRSRFKPTDDPMQGGRFLVSRGFAEDEIESALEDYFAVR